MRRLLSIFTVAAVLLPTSAIPASEGCSQLCLLSNAGRLPVFRENGLISTVPLKTIWESIKRNEEYAGSSLKSLLGQWMGEKKYEPIRCATKEKEDGKCIVPITIAGVREYRITDVALNESVSRWVCEFAMPEVIFGDGEFIEDGNSKTYSVKWNIENPVGMGWKVHFLGNSGLNGIEFKNNYPQDVEPPSAEVILENVSSSETTFEVKFKKRPKRIKAFHYDVKLQFKIGNGQYSACDVVDPVIVNTD